MKGYPSPEIDESLGPCILQDWLRKAQKNGETIVGFSFMTILQHIRHFWSRIS
jgi:hypothetical protein